MTVVFLMASTADNGKQGCLTVDQSPSDDEDCESNGGNRKCVCVYNVY